MMNSIFPNYSELEYDFQLPYYNLEISNWYKEFFLLEDNQLIHSYYLHDKYLQIRDKIVRSVQFDYFPIFEEEYEKFFNILKEFVSNYKEMNECEYKLSTFYKDKLSILIGLSDQMIEILDKKPGLLFFAKNLITIFKSSQY